MSKFKKFLWYFGAFYLGAGAIGGCIVLAMEFNVGFLAMTIVLALLSYLCFKKAKGAKMHKKTDKSKPIASQDIIIEANHVIGLPIQEGIECSLKYDEESIEITQGNTKFNLDIAKVTDIATTTDTEIQKQYVSSTGGAIGGYMLFGPLGGIVGGRAKKKNIKTTTHYLVITYRDNEEVKYISFEYIPSLTIIKFVDKFSSNEHDEVLVNL